MWRIEYKKMWLNYLDNSCSVEWPTASLLLSATKINEVHRFCGALMHIQNITSHHITQHVCTSFDISVNSNMLLTLIPRLKVSHAISDSHSSTTHLMPINNVVASSHLSSDVFFPTLLSCFSDFNGFYCHIECSLPCLVEKCHCWFSLFFFLIWL